MEKGIKETLELIDGLKLLAVTGKKVAADGKLSLGDAGALMGLLGKLGDLGKAVSGVDQVPAEVKDLSPEELEQIGAKVLELVAAVKAA